MLKKTIGENAGLIWRLLENKPEILVKDLQKQTKLKDKDFYLAVGWLSRENKVYFFEIDKELYLYFVE